MIVLDASVILKLILPGEESAKVVPFIKYHLLGRVKIAAPELIYYEIANALIMRSKLPLKNALQGFQRIFNLEIETFTLGLEEYKTSVDLAHRFVITVYDASYISLAKGLKCDFITADSRLWEKVKELSWVHCLE
jgi:predicted nucleic acid-binding protein